MHSTETCPATSAAPCPTVAIVVVNGRATTFGFNTSAAARADRVTEWPLSAWHAWQGPWLAWSAWLNALASLGATVLWHEEHCASAMVGGVGFGNVGFPVK